MAMGKRKPRQESLFWNFGDVDAPRDMVYHESIAWAVNYGFAAYLDSNLAYSFYRRLSEADHQAHGLKLLESGLALNPYNFLLSDAGFALAKSPSDVIRFWTNATKPFESLKKAGCPTTGIYANTIRQKLFAVIGKLPVPADATAAAGISTFLHKEKCDNQATVAKYNVAVNGLPSLLNETKTTLKAHLGSTRIAATCDHMAAAITATADRIPDKKQKHDWALECWQVIQGHECYFGKNGQITLDSTVGVLAKLSGQKPQGESEQYQPLLDQLLVRFKAEITNGRNPKGCTQFATTITTVAKQINTAEQKRLWLEQLSQAITGHEEYTPKNSKPLRDPCADIIQKLLNPPAAKSLLPICRGTLACNARKGPLPRDVELC